MRRIQTRAVVIFSLLSALCVWLGVGGAWVVGYAAPAEFRSLAFFSSACALVFAFCVIAWRVIVHVVPMQQGALAPGSREELGYNLITLFWANFFIPLLGTSIVPLPLRRLLYLLLGARLGRGSYVAGTLMDPPLVSMGNDSLVGFGAVVVPHVIEGQRLELHLIAIGDNVTIGAYSVVLAGVTIGDGAVIAAGSVVPKLTRIGAGEFWEGVPARRLTLADLMERRGMAPEPPAVAARRLA